MSHSWQAAFHKFCRCGVRLVLGLFFRARAYGQHNLPREGGGLLLSNHQSFLDPVLVGAGMPRLLTYMARDTLFRNPLLGTWLRLVNTFPVRRGRPDTMSIRRAIEHLTAGRLLLMFPEGTRTRDGELQTVKAGFNLLARRAGVPIIPVAVDGAYLAWPRSHRLPRPRRIRVMYGRIIPADELAKLSDREAADRVHGEIAVLLRKLRCLP